MSSTAVSSGDVPRPDGRTLRSMRTRAAVVEAVLALVREGDLRPTAPRIAERANVSLRSVFQHFSDMGALHAEVARRQLAQFEQLTRHVDATLPLPDRIAAFVEQRTEVLEAVTPVRRAFLANPVSDEGREGFETMRQISRQQVVDVFDAELRQRDAADRAITLEALDLAASWQAWEGLRNYQRLSVAEASAVVVRMLEAVLTK